MNSTKSHLLQHKPHGGAVRGLRQSNTRHRKRSSEATEVNRHTRHTVRANRPAFPNLACTEHRGRPDGERIRHDTSKFRLVDGFVRAWSPVFGS